MLVDVAALRYVAPLREGGSLPGLIETDDLGTYVVKFTGAGQGPKALVAEVITSEIARRLEFRVPTLVTVELDGALAPAEPDQEIQDLLRASVGRNLGSDFLPGALSYDATAFAPEPKFAANLLWLDAWTNNVDRSWRNPNLLWWHGHVWLIDHGATLTFQHNWGPVAEFAQRPYDARGHVMAPHVNSLAQTHERFRDIVTSELLNEVVALVPEQWLGEGPDAQRDRYVTYLTERLKAAPAWFPNLDSAA
ncbi:MAG: aminotransferase class I and II [Corynebacteriales bacterium]|nr:aminotransferase class I and II [Mycobacteriales bacterium]